MPRDKFDQNFLYGSQGQKKRRASIWACKRAEASPSSTHPVPDSPNCNTPFDTSANTRHNAPTTALRDRTSPSRSSGAHAHTLLKARPFTMHPFSRLASTVKQCPWMLGSDINPSAPGHNPDFYPAVPRSLHHDTAVSFVVTDQTRPEQPRFVISCPLEHVDLVREMLAPTGSQRVLSARGSSGYPRDGRELRGMLLDGTPSIELALHHSSGNSAVGSNSAVDHPDHSHGVGLSDNHHCEGENSGASREYSFAHERPSRPVGAHQHGGGGLWSQAGGAPQGFPIPFVPAIPVSHGWYAGPGGNYQDQCREHAAPPFVGS